MDIGDNLIEKSLKMYLNKKIDELVEKEMTIMNNSIKSIIQKSLGIETNYYSVSYSQDSQFKRIVCENIEASPKYSKAINDIANKAVTKFTANYINSDKLVDALVEKLYVDVFKKLNDELLSNVLKSVEVELYNKVLSTMKDKVISEEAIMDLISNKFLKEMNHSFY